MPPLKIPHKYDHPETGKRLDCVMFDIWSAEADSAVWGCDDPFATAPIMSGHIRIKGEVYGEALTIWMHDIRVWEAFYKLCLPEVIVLTTPRQVWDVVGASVPIFLTDPIDKVNAFVADLYTIGGP